MKTIASISPSRFSVLVSMTAFLSVGALFVTDVAAQNPLRYVDAAPPETADRDTIQHRESEREPIDRMPAEVHQAIYQNDQTYAKIHVDRAVEPANHVAPFHVRKLPGSRIDVASEPPVENEQTADSRNDLELIGNALGSVQSSIEPRDLEVVPVGMKPRKATSVDIEPQAVPVEQARNDSRGIEAPAVSVDALVATNASGPALVDSAPAAAGSVSPEFRKVIERIALSTCLVLCGGVGFILVAKQFFKFKNKPNPQKPATNSIQIKSTLKLSPKANLFLVETGKHRMVVASDQTGIRSVVPLTDSFADTLESFDQEESIEDTSALVSAAARMKSTAADTFEIDRGKLPPEMYSLASVGKQAARSSGTKRAKSKSGSANEAGNVSSSEAEIRRKMENALRDQGLKDLLLKSLQAKAA
jgi:flagellar biogenesis protein FliO